MEKTTGKTMEKAPRKKRNPVRIVLSLVCTVAVVTGFIIGDVICAQHESEISSYLSPSTVIYDTSTLTEALNASEDVIQEIAGQGITLMKNDNNALPLDVSKDDEAAVNLFGVGSTDYEVNGFFVFGVGSGTISTEKEDVVFLKEGIEQAGFKVNQTLYDFFLSRAGSNPTTDWWGSSSSSTVLNHAKAWSDTAIITLSRLSGENVTDVNAAGDSFSASTTKPFAASYQDNEADGRNFLQISAKEEAMINYCAENFGKVIVIVNSGNPLELGLLDNDKVDAVLYVPYTGQSGTKQVGNILAGKTTPSGRLTDTFVYDTTANPSYANAFVAATTYGSQLAYSEDIYVGYKWYETADHDGYFTNKGTSYDKVVWRPFGYGLSYTSFSWDVKGVALMEDDTATALVSGTTLDDKSSNIRVSVEVSNTGAVAGQEVVQLYYTPPYTPGGIEKPYVTLCAFAKTDMLYPAGEADDDHPNSQLLSLEFDLYDLASYDCYDKNGNNFCGWELEQGEYVLSLRDNAHTLNACRNAEFTFRIPTDGFRWETDPVTGNEVRNRFTGDAAEAGVPIDGSGNGNEPIAYLSRADFAATFPSAKVAARTYGADITKDATYVTDEKYYAGVTMPTTGSTETEWLLYTLEDGSKAALVDLQRNGRTVVPNEELIMKLGSDYNAEEWEQLVCQMSFIELADIVTRHSCGSAAIESIGKTKDMVFDGPQGLTNSTLSSDNLKNVSGYPAETMVGMTWNVELARQEGAAMGTEVTQVGVIGMYAPAVDLHRHAYNGRNYEQYGEDPLLVGSMGAKAVIGLVTHGISCSIKHFVCSTPGKNPANYNSWLTEQNLRENYLRPFERCVKEGEANFLMTSFNNIGGVKCAYSYELNNGVLRSEWGFRGAIVTDYNVNSATRTSASLIRSGNDLRFQGSVTNRGEISEDNAVDVYCAQIAVKNWLYSICNTYYRTKTYDPNYTATNITIIPGFAWWLMLLIIIEILAIAACGWFVFRSFVPRRLKKAALADGETGESAENGADVFGGGSDGVAATAAVAPVIAETESEEETAQDVGEEPPAEEEPVLSEAPAEESVPAPEPAPTAEPVARQEQFDAMREEIAGLRAELDAMKAQLAAKKRPAPAKTPDAKKRPTARQEISGMRSELDEMKALIRQLTGKE